MKTVAYFPQMNLVCGKDDLRPILSHVFVTKDHCVATNAHIMIIAQTKELFPSEIINIIPEEGFYIHSEDWKKITQCDAVLVESEKVLELVHSKKRNEFIKIESIDSVGKYPDWKSVIPNSTGSEKEAFHFFGINANYLAILQKSICGNNSICIETFRQKKGYLVKSIVKEINTVGLIMPCSTTIDDIEQSVTVPNL